MEGYIKLYKKIIDWGWYQDNVTKSIFLHLLLTASFKPWKKDNLDLERGQLITTVKQLSERLGFSIQQTKTAIQKLKSTNEITIKSTNKYSIITLINYNIYQDFDIINNRQNNKQNNNPATNEQQTKQQSNNKQNEVDNINILNNKNNNINNNIYNAEQKFSDSKREIIDYLNEKTGKNFQHGTAKTIQVIKARMNEGFTVEDFKKVIDVKTAEWMNDPGYEKFLCPETLFSNKFEKYLNQKYIKNYNGKSANSKTGTIIDFEESVRDFEAVYGEAGIDCSIDG